MSEATPTPAAPADVKVAPRRQPKSTSNKPKQLPPYHVVLLNDDEHTYEYVIEMLRSLFGYDDQRGYRLARQVDVTGRAIVLTTHKERAELKAQQILSFGTDLRIASCKGSMSAVVEPAEG